MKRQTYLAMFFGYLVAVILPLQQVYAQSTTTQPPRVLINEVLTESDIDANQEFIELYNPGDQVIDLSGWVVQYRAASGTSWSDKATLNGLLQPKGLIVVATQGYITEVASFFWTQTGGVMSATGGNIRIVAPNAIEAEDTVAWGTGIFGETSPATRAPKGSAIQRIQLEKIPQDTNDNSKDFEIVNPSPTQDNTAPTDSDPVEESPTDPPVDPTPADPPIGDPDPSPEPDPITPETPADPEPAILIPNEGLLAPIITELMIDPATPLTDADDEWIEIYNPNPVPFALKDYRLQTGGTFARTHTFGDIVIPQNSYIVVYSADSNIQLSNTSGAVRVQDPQGLVVGETAMYDDSETGNTFARDLDGTWRWTTTITPETQNIFTEKPALLPVAKTTASTTSKSTRSSAAKTTSVKSASTTKKASAPKSSTPQVADIFSPEVKQTPQTHTLALAVFGVVALGYAIYEYREDIANRVRITRRYLESRRTRRQSL